MKGNDKVKLRYAIPNAMANKIEDIAKLRGISPSQLMEELVERGIKRNSFLASGVTHRVKGK